MHHPTPDDNPPPDRSQDRHKDQQLELGEDESLTALRRAWERTLRALAATSNKQTIDNWLRPLKPLSFSTPVVVLGAPTSFARQFVENKYAQKLSQLLAQFLDTPDVQVRFVISTPDVQPLLGVQPLPLQRAAAPLAAPEPAGQTSLALSPEPAETSLTNGHANPVAQSSANGSMDGSGRASRNPFTTELTASLLNPRYTFDNFVVGKSNRLAHAGAVHVAEAPGKMYNPLFMYGSPGLGKCVAASEYLPLADGRRVRAGELIGTEFTLLTLAKEELRAVGARAEFNAVEPVFAITTESGRRVVRNGEHPFWVASGVRHVRGWTPLGKIRAGDLVAVPECLPAFGDPVPLPEEEIVRLAGVLGVPPAPNNGGAGEEPGTASAKSPLAPPLLGAGGTPAAIFRLPPEQLRLFLSRLFSTDGWAFCGPERNVGKRLPRTEIGFCSASEGLVQDVQELLLKLGILGRISRKAKVNAWTFAIHTASDVLSFAAQVGIFGKEAAVERVRQVAERVQQTRPNRGEWRHRNAPFGMRWEKVASVESAGVEATVAVEVPDYHTFLTTFWEHNTHAMHAIGHRIRETMPQARVVYVSGETFTNHYVAAIRDKRTEDFRRAYRNVDVWLVDDIQTLASKEQTKEEFFHTFNALHQMNKQIVLTSDRSPRELRAMDERLWSRFECGLVADIAPPEFEMRQAILQKKAILESMLISDDVIAFMANLIQSNIRALEGALIKLMAYASLTRSPVTKQLASDVLSGYFVDRPPPREGQARDNHRPEPASAHPEAYGQIGLTGAFPALSAPVGAAGHAVDAIIQAVANQTGVEMAQILAGGGRSNRASRLHGDAGFARQVAMYLTKEMGGAPLSVLAATFGLKSHTAIVHAHARLAKEIEDDPQILSLIGKIKLEVERGG